MDSMYHQFWGAVANYYQRQLTPVQIDQFAADTKGLNADELNAAFKKWRAQSHFMPTPSDINSMFGGEPVTPWQFCSNLLGIIKDHPTPGPGQPSGIKKALSELEWEVYCTNEYRDAIRQQPPKQATYALMNALERVRNKHTKRPREITLSDIKQINYDDVS